MARYLSAYDESGRIIASDTMRGLRFIRKETMRLEWRDNTYNFRGPISVPLAQDQVDNILVWRAPRGIALAYTSITSSAPDASLAYRLLSRGARSNREAFDATIYSLGKPTVSRAGGIGARAWDENGNICFNSNDQFVRVAGVYSTIVNGEALYDKYRWGGSDPFSPYKTIQTGLPGGRTYAMMISQGMWIGSQGRNSMGDTLLYRDTLTATLDSNNNIIILSAQDYNLYYSGTITGYFRNMGNVEVSFLVVDVTGL